MPNACLVFCIDDRFLDGFKVLAFSLAKFGNVWDLPKIVITDSEIVKNDPFIQKNATVVDLPSWLLQEIDHFPLSFDRPLPNVPANREAFIKRQRNTFSKLFAIENFGYDKNIFIDSDMLCIGDLTYLRDSSNDADFYAAPALLKHHIHKPDGGYVEKEQLINNHLNVVDNSIRFNSGIFVSNKNVLGQEKIKELIKIGQTGPHTGDQPIYNKFISSGHFTYRNLFPWYNVERPYFFALGKDGFLEIQSKIKIIHFTGMIKPWWPYTGTENEVAGVEFLYDEWHRIAQDAKAWIGSAS